MHSPLKLEKNGKNRNEDLKRKRKSLKYEKFQHEDFVKT